MVWFKKEKAPKQLPTERRLKMPEGLWVKCSACKEMIYKKEVLKNASVCPKCNYHFRIDGRARLRMLLDDGHYEEFDQDIEPRDALEFEDTKPYVARISQYQKRTGLKDAFISCAGKLGGSPVIIGVMEYGFMGGSMGSVVGEKATRSAERALWFRHMREEAEARGFSWAAWVYRGSGGFALVRSEDSMELQPRMIEALGLDQQ